MERQQRQPVLGEVRQSIRGTQPDVPVPRRISSSSPEEEGGGAIAGKVGIS